MLKPEIAAKQLEEKQFKEPDRRFLPEAADLPAHLKALAFVLLDRNPDGSERKSGDWQALQKWRLEAAAAIDDLSATDRLTLLRMFFPNVAEHVEAGWQLLKRAPYQTGSSRKSFRSPALAKSSHAQRLSWLDDLVELAKRYPADLLTAPALAAWAPYLQARYCAVPDSIGRLLAAVIESGGPAADEVFEILRQSACNEHDVGRMDRHVTRALLLASRSAGWEFIEKMLLAAQRQEGLRQTILETVDEAHPEAYVRMLRLIRDHDLARFSAVVRALNVWIGLQWDSVSVKVVNETLSQLLMYLEDEAARSAALAGKSAESAFLALWTIAFNDAHASIPHAAQLLSHKSVEMRFVGALHLKHLGLSQATAAMLPALDDSDLRVAFTAIRHGYRYDSEDDDPASDGTGESRSGLFDGLERLFQRTPEKPVELKPLVWPWTVLKADRNSVAGLLMQMLGNRPPTRLIPYLKSVHTWHRRGVIEQLGAQKEWDALTRETLLGLAGDGSADVRGAAFEALAKTELTEPEVLRLEKYLTRKTGDLRRGVVGLLVAQSTPAALASAERLMAAADGAQRLAGLEVLRHLAEGNRERKTCRERAEAFQAARKKVSRDEQTHLEAIFESEKERITLDDALGFMNPAGRCPIPAPVRRNATFITPAAVECLKALDELVHQHREEKFVYDDYEGKKEGLLGEAGRYLPFPDRNKPLAPQAEQLPFREVWETWWNDRPANQRDVDGFELVRGRIWRDLFDDWGYNGWQEWVAKNDEQQTIGTILTGGQPVPELRYSNTVDRILIWLERLHPAAGELDWLLDLMETSLALVSAERLEKLRHAPARDPRRYWHSAESEHDWRELKAFQVYVDAALQADVHLAGDSLSAGLVRVWKLMRWRDEPFPGALRRRCHWSLLREAYRAGAADGPTRDDVADHLLGPKRDVSYSGESYEALGELTARKRSRENEQFLAECPAINELVEAARARILEIELNRGEAVTAASSAAWSLGSLWGVDNLLRILAALGKQDFKLPHAWREHGHDRAQTLTKLAQITCPRSDEEPADFEAAVRKADSEGRFPEERILQLAFLAPQWLRFIERYFKWPGFNEGLYWLLAHMKYASGGEDAASADQQAASSDAAEDDSEKEKPSAWSRMIAERTPLSENDRREGAVDVGWFQRVYAQLTPRHWQALSQAARFAANANQARHAQFVADVLLGKASRRELIAAIRKKKTKDHVRLLGLLPLAAGAKRAGDLAERYTVLQEYRRYARDLSSLTKPAALRALEIGMQNLASTAGFPDPLRLEWAMEADAVKDLARGPVSATSGGVTVSLALDEQAQPQVTIVRGDKPLKSVPPAVKKDRKVAGLLERVGDLKRQASRMRQSLETAMCRGDTFTGAELARLAGHAVLAPLLSRLVLIGEGIAGYPDRGGKALRNHAGKLEPVKKNETLRIAHPSDLYQEGNWDKWQHECFRAERLQPFKQLFRELYIITKQEKSDGAASHRFAGQQINPQQATALWGQRGWNTQEGVCKTFFDAGITVDVSFNYGVTTPLEVEGLTLDAIQFRKRDEFRPMPLKKVPPRIFSEVMRDVDLVVSVAHRGGVDPEASASTVEMRASLLRETCLLLGIKNVRIKSSHALIDGELANYSMHLGSATVHRMPGGSLCLVPVHAQHRGRLFLPFADDDPKTAEVISKALLLARDHEIQDPTILAQLR